MSRRFRNKKAYTKLFLMFYFTLLVGTALGAAWVR